jgi:hypothetical protein
VAFFLNRKAAVYLAVPTVVTSTVLILSQWYVYQYPAYDWTTLLAGVAFPLVFGIIALRFANQRLLLFAFLAYFWSIVDDAPVSFDSVFSWPEVTRFHPYLPHLFLEVVLHILTAFFLILTVREALRGTTTTRRKLFTVSMFTLFAFLLSYAQNIPLSIIQTTVENSWYSLDIVEHVVSVTLLYFAIRVAMKLRK